MTPKKNEETKAVVPVNSGDNIPDFLRNEIGKGPAGNIKASDLRLGHIKIMQHTSPEVKDKLFDAGHFVISTSLEDLGTEFEFIPLLDLKQALKWHPRDAGGGIECVSADGIKGSVYGECVNCQYNYDRYSKDPEKQKVKCVKYFNFPSLIAGQSLPVVISFAFTNKSLAQAGTQLVNRKFSTNMPFYNLKFILKTAKDINKKGQDYFGVRLINNGLNDKLAEFETAKGMSEMLSRTTYSIDRGEGNTEADEKAPF